MLHSQVRLYPNPSSYENTENLPTYEEAMAITNLAPISSRIRPRHGFNRKQYNEVQANANFTTEHVNKVNNNLDMMVVVITLVILAIILSLIVWDLILTWPTYSRPKLKQNHPFCTYAQAYKGKL